MTSCGMSLPSSATTPDVSISTPGNLSGLKADTPNDSVVADQSSGKIEPTQPATANEAPIPSKPEEVPAGTDTDAIFLEEYFKRVDCFIDSEVYKVNRRNRQPLSKFINNLESCANIRLRQILQHSDRDTVIQALTTLLRPVPGSSPGNFGCLLWTRTVVECDTILRPQKVEFLAAIWAIYYGECDPEPQKMKTMEEKVAYFRKELQTYPDYRLEDCIKMAGNDRFNRIPQKLIMDTFTRAVSKTETEKLKKTLQEQIMKHVYEEIRWLLPEDIIGKSLQVLDLVKEGETPLSGWIQACLPLEEPEPLPEPEREDAQDDGGCKE